MEPRQNGALSRFRQKRPTERDTEKDALIGLVRRCSGRSALKGLFGCIRIEEAAHGIELTEVESENFHGLVLWVWGWKIEPDVSASAARV